MFTNKSAAKNTCRQHFLTILYYRSRLIADDVPANNTIWVVGDSVLTEAAMHYNALKRKKEPSNELQNLYMENMYAIRLISPGLYTAHQAKNLPNVVLNALVDTLNVKAKVPHTLIIMINDSRFWNDADLLTYQMERIIHRFIKEIRRIVEARNLSLPPRAVNWEYPRIFITRALPLPNNMTKPYPKGFKQNRRRYNRLLLRNEEHCDYITINLPEFTSDNDNKLFAQDGSITHKGYLQLWTTISDAVHKSDNQNRINYNKAKAKQLASQITLTKQELRPTADDDDDMMSDVEHLQETKDTTSHKTKQPVKRALLQEFNTFKSTHGNNSRNYDSSPDSTISEYFTAHQDQRSVTVDVNKATYHRNKGDRRKNFHTNFRGGRKNNWRNQHPHY